MVVVTNAMRGYVSLRAEAVSHAASFEQRDDRLHVRIVETQHGRTVERHFVDEIREARTHVVHVVVVVHVLAIDVGDDGDRRRQHQERSIALVRFDNHQVAGAEMRV